MHRSVGKWRSVNTGIGTTAIADRDRIEKHNRGSETNSQGPDLFPGYVGRFAPSPTGTLHFGSLITALGSWLDARANNGTWLLRIEDIDPPREHPGAADSIKLTLDALGLHWDGEVIYQSQRLAYFDNALELLVEKELLYPCVCSRKSIRKTVSKLGHAAGVYPGTCLNRTHENDQPHSLRIKTSGVQIEFADQIYGDLTEDLATECGDFIVKRRDGLPAYQLAVVVDDFQQAITHVVRGADLLDNTGRQAYLQSVLGYPRPAYMHLPVVLNSAGKKMSKQAGALPLADTSLTDSVLSALRFLNQDPPGELSNALNTEILEWAIANWQPNLIRHAGAP